MFPQHAPYLKGFGTKFKERVRYLQPGFLYLDCYAKVLARPEHRATVDPNHEDACGIPVPVVHFSFCDNDRASWNEMKEKARGIPDTARCKLVVDTDPTPTGFSSRQVGTVRMGNDPRTSVANAFNQAYEVKTLFVVDGSSFTTFPEKNPTLTIMALAVRMARYMSVSYRPRLRSRLLDSE